LGRCIRHRHDWGAILLLDERFTSEKILNGLSKWVRQRIEVFENFDYALQSLSEFVEKASKETIRHCKSLSQHSNSITVIHTERKDMTSSHQEIPHINEMNPLKSKENDDSNTMMKVLAHHPTIKLENPTIGDVITAVATTTTTNTSTITTTLSDHFESAVNTLVNDASMMDHHPDMEMEPSMYCWPHEKKTPHVFKPSCPGNCGNHLLETEAYLEDIEVRPLSTYPATFVLSEIAHLSGVCKDVGSYVAIPMHLVRKLHVISDSAAATTIPIMKLSKHLHQVVTHAVFDSLSKECYELLYCAEKQCIYASTPVAAKVLAVADPFLAYRVNSIVIPLRKL
jgi:hypothetical protein